jgi:hypothetical protein
MQTESILEKGYDFLKFLLPIIGKLPRDQRFLLGERMQNLSMEILELLTEAYYIAPFEKKQKLQKVNLQLEMLRYYVRLCYETGYYNSGKYKEISEKLLELGRMTGGWIKSIK